MRIKQEEWTVPQFVYALLMGGLLLDYLVIQAFDQEPFPYPAIIAFSRIVVSLMGIYLGKLWKDKQFLLLLALLLIQIFRVAYNDTRLIFSDVVSSSILNGLWAISGCYAVGRVLSLKKIKGFLRVLLAAWTFGIIIHCSIALYAAWKDLRIPNLSGGSIWGIPMSNWGSKWPERLSIGYVYPTVAGSTLSLSGVLALIALIIESKKGIKALYGLAFVMIIITLSLTDARTSIISFSAGAGMITCSGVLWLWWKRKSINSKSVMDNRKHSMIVWLISIVCMLGVFALSMITIPKIVPVFNAIKIKGGIVIPYAYAEETDLIKQQIISRGFTGADAFSGRIDVWKNAIKYIIERPNVLIFGESIHNPMAGINSQMGTQMAHCHNMFLQLLIENGIIGLLPITVFFIVMITRLLRSLNNKTTPLWLRMIPAIVVSIMVGDLAECFAWFRPWKCPALPFLFVAMGIINLPSVYNQNTEQGVAVIEEDND